MRDQNQRNRCYKETIYLYLLRPISCGEMRSTIWAIMRGAIADYTMAIRLKPDLVLAYNNRGVAKANLRQHSAAILDYDVAIRLKPDDATAYSNRGLAKADLGQYFAAISDYDIAIRLKPDHATAYYNRGVAKALLKRTWEAKQDLQTALRLAKKAGDARLKFQIEEVLQIIR